MQKFKYTAVNINKEKFTGIFMAQNEKDLAVQLAKQNLYLVSSKPYSDKSPSAFFTLGVGGIKLSELTTFCRQYAIMINSGMSILACIDGLRQQSFSAYFKNILNVVYDDVKGGLMLSDAFNKHKKVFPDFFRSMVKVGEMSGKLDMVFNSLADYYETDSALRRKTKSALAYPIMLLVLTVAIVAVMLTYIVPTFRQSLSTLEIEPEGITKIVYDISDWVLENGLYLLSVIIAIVAIGWLIGKTEKGSYFYDVLKLKLPLIGKINISLVTARFARGFGLLLTSGMDIIDAMESIQILLGNKDVCARFKKATEDVRHGSSMSVAFTKYKLFPELLIQMISVGEKSAAVDDVLNRSCNFFDNQVEATLTSVTGAIQPIMIMLMGGVVGIMFLAIYSPMLSIMTGLGA